MTRRSGATLLWAGLVLVAAAQPDTEAPSIDPGAPQEVADSLRLDPADAPDAAFVVQARPLKGLKADVATLILSGQEAGALRAAALAVPLREADGSTAVAFWVELEGETLLGTGETPEILRLELYAYAITMPEMGVKGFLSQRFQLDVEELGEVLFAGGAKFGGHLELGDLDPGLASIEVRILVRETGSQRFVLRILEVPLAGEGRATLGTPLVAEAPADWIRVHESAHGERSLAAGVAVRGPRGLLPAALPVLTAGDERTVLLPASGVAAGRGAVRLLDAERRPVAEAGLEAAAPGGAAPEGLPALDARFTLPDVGTGNYWLEIGLGQGGRDVVAPALPVYVLGLEIAAAGVSTAIPWTGVQRLATDLREAPERRREALELAETKRTRKRLERISEAYESALVELSTGAGAAAVDTLAALEEEVIASAPEDFRTLLPDAQLGLVARVSEGEVESLVPILLLHMDLHDRYVEQRRFALAAHAREVVIRLAESYAQRADNEFAPMMASEALASVGAYLQDAQMRAPGRRMLEKALELDPTNTFALLNLAVANEIGGDYREAAVQLEKLLEIEPRHIEGRVRLAINLRRIGRANDAARLLRRIIDDGASDWSLALAYQELARHQIRQGRSDLAVKLLEEGVARLPSQPQLRLQLAYAYDRNGQRRRSLDLLAELPSEAGDPTPRFFYNRRPKEDRSASRRELRRGSMVRLPTLARALGEHGGSVR